MFNKLKTLLILFWKDEGGWVQLAMAAAPLVMDMLSSKKKGKEQPKGQGGMLNEAAGTKPQEEGAEDGGGMLGGMGGMMKQADKGMTAMKDQYLKGVEGQRAEQKATMDAQAEDLTEVTKTLGDQSEQRRKAITSMSAGFLQALGRGK